MIFYHAIKLHEKARVCCQYFCWCFFPSCLLFVWNSSSKRQLTPKQYFPGLFLSCFSWNLEGQFSWIQKCQLALFALTSLKSCSYPGFLFMSLMRSLKVINDLIFHLEGLKRVEKKKTTPKGYIQSQMPGTCDCSLNWKTIFVDVIKRSRWDCPRLSRWP